MSLIIYPTQDWQSFLDEAEADAWMLHQRDNGGWDTLPIEQKELLLIQTASQIRLCNNIVLPDDNEADLKEGQAYLLLQATRTDMTLFDPNEKDITKEKVGELEVNYAYRDKDMTATSFPPMSTLFLSQYGCKSGGGYSQSRVAKA